MIFYNVKYLNLNNLINYIFSEFPCHTGGHDKLLYEQNISKIIRIKDEILEFIYNNGSLLYVEYLNIIYIGPNYTNEKLNISSIHINKVVICDSAAWLLLNNNFVELGYKYFINCDKIEQNIMYLLNNREIECKLIDPRDEKMVNTIHKLMYV